MKKMKANLPDNEIARIHKLRALNILDTSSEKSFDDVVALAQLICQVPIAVVSLVDVDRQWFKSCLGLAARETPRDVAFCAHAILEPTQPLIVEDTHQDPRFFDNALVTGEPYIRFYAGVPLTTHDGFALGTLCIIDHVVRQLTREQIDALKRLASQVEQLLYVKELNQEKIEQQERIEFLANSAPYSIGEINTEKEYLFVNHVHQAWYGQQQRSLDISSDSKKSLLINAIDAAFSGQESRIKIKTRDNRFVNIDYLPKYHDGKITSVFELGADITESQRLLDDVKKSREFLKSILSNLPGTVYRCGAQAEGSTMSWRVEFVSPSIEVLTGNPREYFTGNPLSRYSLQIVESDRKRVYYSIMQAILEKRPFKLEYQLQKTNGEIVTVEDSGCGVYDELGVLQFVDGFVCNIDERKQLQYQQIEMTEKLKNLFEAAPIGIVQMGEDLNIIEANPEMARMLGYERADLKGMNILQITPGDEHSLSFEAIKQVKADGRFGPFHKNYLRKNGTAIPVEITGAISSPSFYADKDQVYWWTLVKDMTEQQRVDKLKNEFISAVSHELRTPLTSISGALGIVVSGVMGELPQKAEQLLTIAQRNSLRLTALINDLLDMDKLSAGKMQFDFQYYSVEKLVRDAATENQSYTEGRGVVVRVSIPDSEAIIRVDQLRFQQILSNFVSNAAKFSEPGSAIDISVEHQGHQVKIAVTDYGIGIPDDFKDKLFTKFSQVDASDSRAKGGTGLGLAITKQLAEKMGGSVGFSSEYGKGSCFYTCFSLVSETTES